MQEYVRDAVPERPLRGESDRTSNVTDVLVLDQGELASSYGLQLVINQQPDGIHELDRVGKEPMSVKRGFTAPTRVDIELLPVPQRAVEVVTDASRLTPCRMHHVANRSLECCLTSASRVETSEYENLLRYRAVACVVCAHLIASNAAAG